MHRSETARHLREALDLGDPPDPDGPSSFFSLIHGLAGLSQAAQPGRLGLDGAAVENAAAALNENRGEPTGTKGPLDGTVTGRAGTCRYRRPCVPPRARLLIPAENERATPHAVFPWRGPIGPVEGVFRPPN